jgi:hypothetical protein
VLHHHRVKEVEMGHHHHRHHHHLASRNPRHSLLFLVIGLAFMFWVNYRAEHDGDSHRPTTTHVRHP